MFGEPSKRVITLESRADYYLRPDGMGASRDIEGIGPEYDPILTRLIENTPVDSVTSSEFSSNAHQNTSRKFNTEICLVGAPINISSKAELRTRHQIRLRKGTLVKGGVIFNGRSRISEYGIDAGEDFYVKEGTYIDAYGGFIKIGRGAAIAQYCAIHGNGGVTIGDYLMMGHGALILAGNHNHDATNNIPFIFQGSTAVGIKIGSNVWIGAGAMVLDGVTIGDNVIVAGGSVVREDIPSNTLAFTERPLKMAPIK